MDVGRSVWPGDSGWEAARRGFAAHPDYDSVKLCAVIFAQSRFDVQRAIQVCLAERIPFRLRSGRHCYEGLSSLVDGIIIDFSEMRRVEISRSDQTARIESGCYMLELSERLHECGFTIPMATGPTVGIAGLTLGGGFGLTSRKWGLTCDSVVSIDLVNAAGEFETVSVDSDPDKFWALLGGGGGNFGAVTSFVFKLQPIDKVALFQLHYRWEDFENVVNAWQRWHHDLPNDFSTFLTLVCDGQICITGQFTPSHPSEFASLDSQLAPVMRLGPLLADIQVLPSLVASRIGFRVDPVHPVIPLSAHDDFQIFKSTSHFTFDPLPIEAIQLLKASLEGVPELAGPPSQPTMIQILGGGGKINSTDHPANSVAHRSAYSAIQLDAYWTAQEDSAKMLNWISQLRKALEPYTRGSYVNYADLQIEDPMTTYFGENADRLKTIKAKIDPNRVFDFPLAIR